MMIEQNCSDRMMAGFPIGIVVTVKDDDRLRYNDCHNGVHRSKHKQPRPVASNHLCARPHYEEKTYYVAMPSQEQHLRLCRGRPTSTICN